MNRETDFEYLTRRLRESKGQYGIISRATGVPYFTVARVARQEGSPRQQTVEPLVRYFRALDAADESTATG